MRRVLKHRGFTLIEILVVVFVMIVILGLASLNFNFNPKNQLKSHGQQIIKLLQIARDQAVFQQQTLMLVAEKNTLMFFYFDNQTQEWHALKKTDNFFRDRKLPQGVSITLEGEIPSQIMILPSGELSEFVMRLRSDRTETTYRLSGVGNAAIELIREDPS